MHGKLQVQYLEGQPRVMSGEFIGQFDWQVRFHHMFLPGLVAYIQLCLDALLATYLRIINVLDVDQDCGCKWEGSKSWLIKNLEYSAEVWCTVYDMSDMSSRRSKFAFQMGMQRVTAGQECQRIKKTSLAPSPFMVKLDYWFTVGVLNGLLGPSSHFTKLIDSTRGLDPEMIWKEARIFAIFFGERFLQLIHLAFLRIYRWDWTPRGWE